MISLSLKRFVMGAFLFMACGYVTASPGVILAEPTSLGPLGPGGNFSIVDGDAGEVEVMPVEGSNDVSVQSRSGGPSCDCDEIGVSGGYEFQSTRMGVFTRTGTVMNGRWVYKNSEDQYLYFSYSVWSIGSDFDTHGVKSASTSALCPEDVDSDFEEYEGSSEWGGSVAVVCRVPAPTGCDEFALSGEGSTHSSQMGKYTRTNTRTADGRWVYKHDNDNYLFYWPQYKDWRLGRDYKYPLAFLQTGNAASLHPTEATAWYKWSGGQWVDANIQAECSGCGVQVLGSWQPIQYSSGSQEISYYAGFEQSNGYSSSSTFRSEVSSTVSAGFTFGPDWAQGSASVELTASLAAEFTNEVSSSMSISRSTTQTYTFDKAGQVWQWVYLVRDACRATASNTVGTKNLVTTPSRTEKPCCPAGYAADASISSMGRARLRTSARVTCARVHATQCCRRRRRHLKTLSRRPTVAGGTPPASPRSPRRCAASRHQRPSARTSSWPTWPSVTTSSGATERRA